MARKRKQTMHNLQDLVEHGPHQDRGEFIRMLLDLWRGKTLMDIATEVATFVYEDAAEDDLDAEELAEEERLMVPPSPGKPVPKDLLEPKTLLDAVRRLEMDLERSGNEDRARCAGQVRCRLLSGNIHTVAKELTDLAEEAAQTWDRLIDGDDDDEEDEDE